MVVMESHGLANLWTIDKNRVRLRRQMAPIKGDQSFAWHLCEQRVREESAVYLLMCEVVHSKVYDGHTMFFLETYIGPYVVTHWQ